MSFFVVVIGCLYLFVLIQLIFSFIIKQVQFSYKQLYWGH